MKMIIRFFLDHMEVCATELIVKKYKTLEAIEGYIKENYIQFLTDELYTGEDFTKEDYEWFDEIIERFPNEGEIIIESVIPL